jgi:hypothetical protein
VSTINSSGHDRSQDAARLAQATRPGGWTPSHSNADAEDDHIVSWMAERVQAERKHVGPAHPPALSLPVALKRTKHAG